MKKFSKKDKKADLKEYSNQVTKQVNDYIVSHPNIMHEVILAANSLKNEDELYFWMNETLATDPAVRHIYLEAEGTELVQWRELAYAWFNTVKHDEALPGEFSIENLPVLDKKKKLDELLEDLSKEIDPTKKEQIKQHITRIKNAKLLRADVLGDPTTPYQPAEERGKQEISVYDEEYLFLKKLINTVVKAGVPPEEIKALSQSHPFQTIDDIGDLAAQIWTLATTKYNIPREWLIKKLPERKACLKQADLKEFSNEETKGINDFIIQHPKIMEVVIDAAKRAEDEKHFTDWLQEALTKDYSMESGIREVVKWDELGWAWFNTVNREHSGPSVLDTIKEMPTLDKSKKIDELLEYLSKETDPIKQERIKQHITRIKNANLLKADLWPGQEASEDIGMPEWNSTAYNPLHDRDTSVSGPRPDDVEKKSSPETDHALSMSVGEDIINQYFFQRGIRWSQVVQFIKDQAPQLTDEDIVNLKTDTKYKLEQYKIQIDSKKKGLSLDKVLQILEQKGPKPTHVDYTDLSIEFQDGSKMSFDDATKKAIELSKSSSAESEEQERNKDSGTGFYDTPYGADLGKRPDGDFPSVEWMPSGQADKDEEPWDNIAASKKFSKKPFLKISKPKSGYVDNGVGYTCGRCEYFNAEKERCKLVEGTIKSFGCCNFWDGGDKDKEVTATKGSDRALTKEEAVYIEYSDVDYRCDECVFFDPKTKTCTKVEGEISPTASCNLWQPISKKQSSLHKVANPPSRFWIAPDGKEFPVAGVHSSWLLNQGKNILPDYGIIVKDKNDVQSAYDAMLDQGWVRISNEPAGTGFQIQVNNYHNIPEYIDEFISKYFKNGDKIFVGDNFGMGLKIDDPFPSLQKAVNKALKTSVWSMLKKADVSGKQINDILKLIEANGGATYNLSQGNLVGQNAFAVSIYPDREKIVDLVDYDTLEGYLVDNQDLLNDPKNSFGAWTSGGKVYLDTIITVPTQEEALRLAHDNNQLAIFDLSRMEEITVGLPAFSKKELNIVKKAEEQLLTQEQQDQIASVAGPTYNIALNNYASAVKRGHSKDRALAYAIDSVKNLENLDPKKLVELANTYLKGLV